MSDQPVTDTTANNLVPTSPIPPVPTQLTPDQVQRETRIILWLRHIGINSSQLVSLWRHFGNFHSALQAESHSLAELLDHSAYQNLVRQRDRWQQHTAIEHTEDTTLLPISSADYPTLLQQLHCPPALLYVRGNINVLSLPQIAIVGSRKHTTSGGNIARSFARELCDCGFTITSGLALGIDALAHQGALQAAAQMGGNTIAVLASGVENIYPRRHQLLAQQILDNGGALISEMPVNTQPLPAYFPQRNRIISGLSLGALVVEAASKSGSLITARYAMEQGREVFAIPGSIHSPSSRGCHQLIREGATLVETVADIAEQLGAMVALKRDELHTESTQALPADEQQLLTALGYDPVDFDTLINRTGLASAELTTLLLNLELQGLLEQGGGKYTRIS